MKKILGISAVLFLGFISVISARQQPTAVVQLNYPSSAQFPLHAACAIRVNNNVNNIYMPTPRRFIFWGGPIYFNFDIPSQPAGTPIDIFCNASDSGVPLPSFYSGQSAVNWQNVPVQTWSVTVN